MELTLAAVSTGQIATCILAAVAIIGGIVAYLRFGRQSGRSSL